MATFNSTSAVVIPSPTGTVVKLYPINDPSFAAAAAPPSFDPTPLNNALLADANANAHANDTHTVGSSTDTVSRVDISNAVGTGFHIPGTSFDDTGFGTGAQWQFLYGTVADSLVVTAETPNVFINTGSGNDVLTGLSGRNILDGGSGYNTYLGGSGTDTFVADMRTHPAGMLIDNFKSGDNAILVGAASSIEESFENGADDVRYTSASNGAVMGQIILPGVLTGALTFGSSTVNGVEYQFIHSA